MSKALFVAQTIQAAFQLGQIARHTTDLIEVYLDRGYADSDPLTVEDLNTQVNGYPVPDPANPMTMVQFAEIAELLLELKAFMDNQPVLTKDRGLIVNKYRTDV